MSPAPSIPSTSSSLILRIRQDDQTAWMRFEFLYRPLIVYWCRCQNVEESDIDDIVQNTFMTIHKFIAGFVKHKDKASFRPWLRSIVTSRINDHRSRVKRVLLPMSETSIELIQQVRISSVPDPTDIDNETETQILFRQILEAVKQDVQPQTFEAFYLTAVEQLDSETVAEKLGMTPANVRKAKSNVKKRIKEEFAGLFD